MVSYLFSFIVVNSFCFGLVFCDLVHDVCMCVGMLTANSIQKSFDYE